VYLFLVVCLAFQKDGIHTGGVEGCFKAGQRILGLKGLTGKDIEVDIVRLFDEVSRDVRCLNQLNESVALLVSIPEHHDTRFAEGHHVDLLDEILGERADRGLGSESDGVTVRGIYDQMIAPATFFMSGPLGPFLSRISSSSRTHLLYA